MKKQTVAEVTVKTANKQTPITVIEETIDELVDRAVEVGKSDNGIPDLTGIKFATPKTVKGKSTRPICEHTHMEKAADGTTTTKRCQLRVLDGEPFCVNHVPAERRLTEDEGLVLSAWLETMTPADRLVLYVRTVGWFKAKEQAKAI